MEFENLTKEEKQTLLQNDVEFALNFVVDNQPLEVINQLVYFGSKNVHDKETAFNNLVYLYENDKETLEAVLMALPYDGSMQNYTGGVIDVSEQGRQTRSFSWGSLFEVVGGAIAGVGGLLGNDTDSTLTQAELDFIEAERLKKEEEEKQARNRMLIIGGLIALAIIIAVFVSFSKKKKETVSPAKSK